MMSFVRLITKKLSVCCSAFWMFTPHILILFQMFLGQIFSNELLRRMVLVGPRNSHHTLRGFVLILNQRICEAGGRNTPTEWL